MKAALTVVSCAPAYNPAMADELALIAHLLRRTSFGPRPGQVEELARRGVDAAVTAVLDAPDRPADLPALGTDDDAGRLVRWWLARMRSAEAGLHEKMTWFWHGHFTSSLDKVGEPLLMARQNALLRHHALGNFRALVHDVLVDAAMLRYLDGEPSTGDAPNENLARELMELFTLGRGHYGEDDVRAGARALAGWHIDDDGNAVLDPSEAYPGEVTFLGRTGRLSAGDVADAVCDHPACAAHIADRVWRFLAGTVADADTVAHLAAVFRDAGLEVRPLVEAVVRHPSFLDLRMTRPRFPVEWFTAASLTLGDEGDPYHLDQLGQVPFYPPNVAGWPVSPKWLSAANTLARARIATEMAWDTEVVDTADPAGAALARAGLFEVSDATRAGLAHAAASIEGRRERTSVLLALAVSSPEFALA